VSLSWATCVCAIIRPLQSRLVHLQLAVDACKVSDTSSLFVMCSQGRVSSLITCTATQLQGHALPLLAALAVASPQSSPSSSVSMSLIVAQCCWTE